MSNTDKDARTGNNEAVITPAGQERSDEKVVADQFGGLDNDLMDVADFSDPDEPGPERVPRTRVGPEDEKREDLRGDRSGVQQMKEDFGRT